MDGVGGNAADSLVGREHVLALVADLVERPRSGDRPVPIVVLAGPGGSGKTHLVDHLERVSRPELPCARINLSDDPGVTSCRAVLDAAYRQLRDYHHPQFGRLRLRRYELGRAMQFDAAHPGDGATESASTDPAEPAGDPSRATERTLAGFVARLGRRWKVPSDAVPADAVPSRLVRVAFGWLLRLLVPTSLVVRRGVLRRLLWGRRDDAAMSWYEAQAPRLRLPTDTRIDQVAAWFTDPPGGRGGHAMVDELLLDALLADLRANYRGRRHRRYRTGYCLLLLDDADLLRPLDGDNVLRLLADRRRARQWDPLVVVATKQGGLAEEIGTGPVATGGTDTDATEATDATRATGATGAASAPGGRLDYRGWRARYDTATESNPYLPVRLGRLGVGQTRRLVADLVAVPALDGTGLVLPEEMHRVSRGHPLAVRLLTESLRTEHVRWPARELPSVRSRTYQVMANPPPDALREETIGGYLLRRMLQRVTQPGEYSRLSDELLLCGTARRLDAEIVRMLLTDVDQPDAQRRARAERWLDQVAEYSFTEAVDGDAIVLHPLLADLLAERLARTGTGEQSSYRLVHRRLRDHFAVRSNTGDETALGEYLYHCLALGDIRPLTDRLTPVLTDRTVRTRQRWLRLLLSVTEAPMPRLPRLSADPAGPPGPAWTQPHPLLHRLRDLIGTDRPHRDAQSAVTEAVLCLWLLRSSSSDARWDEVLLDRAVRAARALPGANHESVARGLARHLDGLARYASGDQQRDPLPRPAGPRAPAGARPLTLRRVWPSRRARRRSVVAAVLVPCLAFAGWFGVRVHDYGADTCAPGGVVSALRGGGPTDGRLITRTADGQCVGITDGTFHFSSFTAPYEEKIRELNKDVARRVAHGQRYVTVVVASMFSSQDPVSPQKDIGSGVNELQGAFLAQWEYDTGGDPKLARRPDPLLRVLMANIGGRSAQAALVARKIVDLARTEPVVAVTGLPQTRPETLSAVRILARAGIPMVASVVSGDEFTDLDHFFRVAPSNDQEAAALVHFATSRLRDHLTSTGSVTPQTWLLGDEDDQYSRNLSADLARRLGQAGVRVGRLPFTAASTTASDQIRSDVAQPCMGRSDPLIFYTGRADELGTVFGALTDRLCGDAVVISGDDVSSLQAPPNEGFPTSAIDRLYFAAFAAPDQQTWLRLHDATTPAPFYGDHTRFFPHDEANGAEIAAYDAVGVLTRAVQAAVQDAPDQPVRAGAVYQRLRRIRAYPGVSGVLDFSADDGARDRSVLVAKVTGTRQATIQDPAGTR